MRYKLQREKKWNHIFQIEDSSNVKSVDRFLGKSRKRNFLLKMKLFADI